MSQMFAEIAETMPVVSRRGRKRKSGHRKPSGDLQAQPKVDYLKLAASWPHRRDLPEGERLSEKAATPFGRLLLWGRINEVQYRAGEIAARRVRDFYIDSGAPKSSPRSIAGNMVASELPKDHAPISFGGLRLSDEEVRKRYEDIYDALDTHDTKACRAFSNICVFHHRPEFGQLEHLIRALDRLVVRLGLTAGHKSVGGGK